MVKWKIYGLAVAVVIIFAIVLEIRSHFRTRSLTKELETVQQELRKERILRERIQADVAANKEREKLQQTMDNSSDRANLEHIPELAILNELRSNPM